MISVSRMEQPPNYLISLTMILWGYQSGLLVWAVVMAVLLELRRWIHWRRQLTDTEFYQLGNLCTFVFLCIVVLSFTVAQQRLFIHQVVLWLPFVFYPLLLGEYYSDRQASPLGALIYGFRKKNTSSVFHVRLGYIYFAVCLLAASTASQLSSDVFFVVLMMLIGWGLWPIKPLGVTGFRWVLVFSTVIGLAYAGQLTLIRLNQQIQVWSNEYLDSLFQTQRDPLRSRTAMGAIGELKLSNKIVMRVKTDNSQSMLLQEAVYDVFYDNHWFSRQRTFDVLTQQPGENRWLLSAPIADNLQNTLTIYRSTDNHQSLLARPLSLSEVFTPMPVMLSTNHMGTIKAEYTPDLFEYRIGFYQMSARSVNENQWIAESSDLMIPKPYQTTIAAIHESLGLGVLDSKDVVEKVADYFTKNYRYSLYQTKLADNTLALNEFLETKHRGHCEFFASATVLLLRSAGIPARYVVGYAASEYDARDELFIVRARDSHAWAQAYVNGRWINVDNTPAIWFEAERETASLFEPITDALSRWYYHFRLWQGAKSEQGTNVYLVILGVVLALIILLRKQGKSRWLKRNQPVLSTQANEALLPYDSVMQQVVLAASVDGIVRHVHEPLLHWQQRFALATADAEKSTALKDIIRLYYQLRFDSNVPTEALSTRFYHKADAWLKHS